MLPWEPCKKVLIAFETFLQGFDNLIVGIQREVKILRQHVLIPKINHIQINFTTIFKVLHFSYLYFGASLSSSNSWLLLTKNLLFL